ncbi:zinc-ribbon domain-containing protein [Ligilactobacillus ruminis]|uniref:zinc-ribbon domain-containing protein n=1 Tax=Ligilactobacillus ruminis TaxID=1623 RepID=UPI001F15BFE0|nr:zinc-ribbon domain-containing protein [Ligilactobacillus ruminis]
MIWRCEKGHEGEAAVKSRTINKTGCPYCSHNKVLAGFNDLATLLPDIAAEWSDRNYPLLPTQVTVFVNRKAWWKCKDCGREWNTLISNRYVCDHFCRYWLDNSICCFGRKSRCLYGRFPS